MDNIELASEPNIDEFSEAVFTIDTLVQLEAEFVGIDRAIEALQNGSYGRCEVCNTQISNGRLRSDPVLVRCDAHVVRETPALFTESAEFTESFETTESVETLESFETTESVETPESNEIGTGTLVSEAAVDFSEVVVDEDVDRHALGHEFDPEADFAEDDFAEDDLEISDELDEIDSLDSLSHVDDFALTNTDGELAD
jgi:hypothetical protein